MPGKLFQPSDCSMAFAAVATTTAWLTIQHRYEEPNNKLAKQSFTSGMDGSSSAQANLTGWLGHWPHGVTMLTMLTFNTQIHIIAVSSSGVSARYVTYIMVRASQQLRPMHYCWCTRAVQRQASAVEPKTCSPYKHTRNQNGKDPNPTMGNATMMIIIFKM